jgi:hypothetical protein
LRYAIDAGRARRELGWQPAHDLATGLRKTVQWYLNNESWWRPLLDNSDVLGRKGRLRSLTGAEGRPAVQSHIDGHPALYSGKWQIVYSVLPVRRMRC